MDRIEKRDNLSERPYSACGFWPVRTAKKSRNRGDAVVLARPGERGRESLPDRYKWSTLAWWRTRFIDKLCRFQRLSYGLGKRTQTWIANRLGLPAPAADESARQGQLTTVVK